jgi:hypothetical protein
MGPANPSHPSQPANQPPRPRPRAPHSQRVARRSHRCHWQQPRIRGARQLWPAGPCLQLRLLPYLTHSPAPPPLPTCPQVQVRAGPPLLWPLGDRGDGAGEDLRPQPVGPPDQVLGLQDGLRKLHHRGRWHQAILPTCAPLPPGCLAAWWPPLPASALCPPAARSALCMALAAHRRPPALSAAQRRPAPPLSHLAIWAPAPLPSPRSGYDRVWLRLRLLRPHPCNDYSYLRDAALYLNNAEAAAADAYSHTASSVWYWWTVLERQLWRHRTLGVQLVRHPLAQGQVPGDAGPVPVVERRLRPADDDDDDGDGGPSVVTDSAPSFVRHRSGPGQCLQCLLDRRMLQETEAQSGNAAFALRLRAESRAMYIMV